MIAPLTMTEDEWKWLSSCCDCASINWAEQKLLRQARAEIEALRAVVAAGDKLRARASCESDERAFPLCCDQCTNALRYDHVRGRGPA